MKPFTICVLALLVNAPVFAKTLSGLRQADLIGQWKCTPQVKDKSNPMIIFDFLQKKQLEVTVIANAPTTDLLKYRIHREGIWSVEPKGIELSVRAGNVASVHSTAELSPANQALDKKLMAELNSLNQQPAHNVLTILAMKPKQFQVYFDGKASDKLNCQKSK